MAVYHCNKCHFTFKREGEVDSCPDCGKPDIRLATDEEIEEFNRYLKEHKWDNE